jgi:hypothetical protein
MRVVAPYPAPSDDELALHAFAEYLRRLADEIENGYYVTINRKWSCGPPANVTHVGRITFSRK